MSKPKIVVLHMRELIYTAIFIFLILDAVNETMREWSKRMDDTPSTF